VHAAGKSGGSFTREEGRADWRLLARATKSPGGGQSRGIRAAVRPRPEDPCASYGAKEERNTADLRSASASI